MQTISTNMWKEPFDNSPYSDTVWEDQITATGSDLGNNAFKEISISVGDAYYPKQFSRSSLEDSYVNLDSHVMGCVSDGIDRNIAAGVLTGLGTTESPLRGMLTFDDGTGWGQVEQIESAVEDSLSFDDVLDGLPSALIDGYHANAKFIMRRQSFHKLIIAKDNEGKYQIGNQIQFFSKEGIPLDILGYPVMFDAGMPAVADGALSVMFGDFEAAYKKVNRIGFSIHRNDSNAKFVTLTGRKRVGGNVINFEAYKILRIK
jgi:HK97 family phage major capsid protein